MQFITGMKTRTLFLIAILLPLSSGMLTAQRSPSELVFAGLSGYWSGQIERRDLTDTTLLPVALDIRRSLDGEMIILTRSVRMDDRIHEHMETMIFNADSLLLHSAIAAHGKLERHRYTVQGLHRVRNPDRWVIRRTESTSESFHRVTDVMQNDSLIMLSQTSEDGLNWQTEEIIRVASRARPARATFFLPGFERAQSVNVVGSFNGWEPGRTVMRRERGGWHADVDLPPGEYEYKFWVDGTLVRDLLSSTIISDGEGGYNALLIVR